jgi:enoyl-CoA hydratase/carnithine racemase
VRAAGALSLTEALGRLASPDAPEAFSLLTGDAVLVVDLDTAPGSAATPSSEQVERARTALAQLPCPSIEIRARSLSRIAAELVGRFDVAIDDVGELAPLLASIERTPIAAMALVQLLRHSEQLSIHEGLIAESLMYSTLQSGPEFGAWLADRGEPRVREPNPEPAVLVHRKGARLDLILNRTEKRNAFSAEMRDGLVEGIRIALHDDSIKEVGLSGLGPAFCSGGDLDEFGSLPDPATAHAIRATRNPGRLLAACADRVHARIHGACVGAGIELPAFARSVTAAPGTFFLLPEVAMGLVPGAGGTVSIPLRIGRQRTAQWALSVERLDVDTALRWGLIDAIDG